MKENAIKDPLTGELFIPKSSKQKYATPANQIKHNNINAKMIRILKYDSQRPLDVNWKIISKMMGTEKEITRTTEFMRGAGFSLPHCTHWKKYEGKSQRCVFNFIIVINDTDKIKIVKDE